MRTLITCGWLVTMDPSLGNIQDAELLIDGDAVIAIGKSLSATYDELIDASDKIVMPGLIDAHVHLWQSGLRGIGVDWVGEDYFKRIYFGIGNQFGPDDNRLGNFLGALSYIDNGVTSILDFSHNISSLEMAEASIDGLEQSGIRALFAHSPAPELNGRGEPSLRDSLHPRERVMRLRSGRLSSDDRRVRLGLGLIGPQSATQLVVEDGIRLARELGVQASTHAVLPDHDTAWPGGYLVLAKSGLLGPDHNIVHGNFLSDEELDEIVGAGASVTSTVTLELQVGLPDPVVTRVRERGGMPSLGVDVPSMVPNDMFREMGTALLQVRSAAFRRSYQDGTAPLLTTPATAHEALQWATIGNAHAMGMHESIGRLAPGMKADIVMLRKSDLNVFPVFDPIAVIVGQAGTKNVDTVIVDGIVRKRDGRLIYDDVQLAQQRKALLNSVETLLEQAGLPERPS